MNSKAKKEPDKTNRDLRTVYTAIVIDHAQHPRNLGQIPDADGLASVVGSCGDTMEICMKVRNDKILNATFFTDGCATTIAAGSMVTELAKGKNVSDAFKITHHDVLNALGGLPEESQHCALLASDTLRAAIRDYLAFKNQPWKRAYRAH
ncbi:MAG TPA: iron-sulfur cluster assembly scaffold protein [Dehalococcoidia bacterium]|nr:iron-sulfur cluster assembly scaffold protein [Dehalococcoidia bacterium]